MTWLLPLAVVLVAVYYGCTGYSMGYDEGYHDRMLGEPHRDDRPPSGWRRLFDLTYDSEKEGQR